MQPNLLKQPPNDSRPVQLHLGDMRKQERHAGHGVEALAVRGVILRRVHQVEQVRWQALARRYHGEVSLELRVRLGRGADGEAVQAVEERHDGMVVANGEEGLLDSRC